MSANSSERDVSVRRGHRNELLGSASLLVCLLLITPGQTFAQSIPPAPSGQATASGGSGAPATPPSGAATVGEVVVTAQRREERLQKVPITVSTASAADIEKSGIQTVNDLPRLAPGLTTSAGLGAGNYFFPFIRGIGSAITANGIEASVATYVDGVYQADKESNVQDLEDVQRVEVLKGPQGTLFGRNATGGAINIVTAIPNATMSANGEFSYGRFDETVERAFVNGQIVNNLDGNISLVARQGGGYDYNIPTSQSFGGTNAITVNPKIRWHPTEDFDVTASFLYSARQTSDVGANLISVPGTTALATILGGVTSYKISETSVNFLPKADTTTYHGTLTAKYNLGFAEVVSITAYQNSLDYNLLDYDLTNANVFGFENYDKSAEWTQELQLLSTNQGPLSYVLGGYFINYRELYSPLDYLTAGPGGTPVYIKDYSGLLGGAGYAQSTYSIIPSTRLTAGLRYSYERKTLTGEETLPTLGNTVIAGPIDLAKQFSKLTYRFSLDHDFSKDILVFVSYNRGYKSGGFNATLVGPQDPVAPEVLDAYEVGLKSQLFQHKLQLNGSFYYYDYKDIQISRVSAVGANILQSAGAATLYGVDLSGIYRPTRDLQITAGLNLEHSDYTTFNDAQGLSLIDGLVKTVTIASLKGQQVLNAPNLTFNIGLTYTVELNGHGSVEISPSYSYTSHYQQIAGNLSSIGPNSDLDLTARWNLPGDHRYLGIYGRNLTDNRSLGDYPSNFGDSYENIRPITFGFFLGGRL